ncbi:MAG TPA: hypothetical protein VJU15_01710 [Gemmatimonadales bacterium]|nr:hypothetical protein [Gemmatimonadales bacterium]
MAPRASMALGLALAEQADRTAQWPGIGRREPGPIRLMVAPDAQAFMRVSGGRVPSWGVGLAIPGGRAIVIRADAPDPIEAMRHELAHLALHEVVKVRVPLWFDEGYAVVAAGEWDRMESLRLNLAVVRGAVGDLATLDAALRQSEADAATAYALAGSAVLLLARSNPTQSLDPLIGKLSGGTGFEEAIGITTGYTLGTFERAWQRDLRSRYGWMVWFAAGGGWAVLGLAVLVLARWRRKRDEPRRAALDSGWDVTEDEAPILNETPPPIDPERPGD